MGTRISFPRPDGKKADHVSPQSEAQKGRFKRKFESRFNAPAALDPRSPGPWLGPSLSRRVSVTKFPGSMATAATQNRFISIQDRDFPTFESGSEIGQNRART